MKLTVSPGAGLRGEVQLPGDKSLSHRAALFAALADGHSQIDNFLDAGVTRSMLHCLSGLGVSWQLEDHCLSVDGVGMHGFDAPDQSLDCGNSGTTMRLLAGALAGCGTPAVLDGSAGLRKRPMGRIVEPLRQMGVGVQAAEGDKAPLELAGRENGQSLGAIHYDMPVASAQVKTCLLLAALGAEGVTTLTEPSLSRDHSERMLAGMGAPVEVDTQAFTVHLRGPVERLQPLDMRLPGDFSTAAFLIAAALIAPGSELVIRDVGLNPTRTGLLDVLLAMGAGIEVQHKPERCNEPVGDLLVRHSQLHGAEVSGPLVVRMIDEFPAFASIAAFANGRTTVRDAKELRYKESDRISALCQALASLGVAVEELPDGFIIDGAESVPGGQVPAGGDHRLAMALSLVGLRAEPSVVVQGAEIFNESFPGFLDTMRSLGANLEQVA